MRLTETEQSITKRITQSESRQRFREENNVLNFYLKTLKLSVDFETGKRIIRIPTQRTRWLEA